MLEHVHVWFLQFVWWLCCVFVPSGVSVSVCFPVDKLEWYQYVWKRTQHAPLSPLSVTLCWLSLYSSFFIFQKMICFKLDIWSEWRECYTIGISGLKHQERQNSQSRAHKLHWCGIIWSFACGASLPSPCAVLLLSCHLSRPELTSKCSSQVCFVVVCLF